MTRAELDVNRSVRRTLKTDEAARLAFNTALEEAALIAEAHGTAERHRSVVARIAAVIRSRKARP